LRSVQGCIGSHGSPRCRGTRPRLSCGRFRRLSSSHNNSNSIISIRACGSFFGSSRNLRVTANRNCCRTLHSNRSNRAVAWTCTYEPRSPPSYCPPAFWRHLAGRKRASKPSSRQPPTIAESPVCQWFGEGWDTLSHSKSPTDSSDEAFFLATRERGRPPVFRRE